MHKNFVASTCYIDIQQQEEQNAQKRCCTEFQNQSECAAIGELLFCTPRPCIHMYVCTYNVHINMYVRMPTKVVLIDKSLNFLDLFT